MNDEEAVVLFEKLNTPLEGGDDFAEQSFIDEAAKIKQNLSMEKNHVPLERGVLREYHV